MRNIGPGKPNPRGATFDGHGVNFALFSRVATRVEVCLYGPTPPHAEIDRFDLTETHGHTFHGYVPGLAPGALYGFRVHGPYAPELGHRCNPHKVLVDPYAKAIFGEVDWKQPVLGYRTDEERADLSIDQRDDAAGAPKSVVVDESFDWGDDRRPTCPGARRSSTRRTSAGSRSCTPRSPRSCAGPTRASVTRRRSAT